MEFLDIIWHALYEGIMQQREADGALMYNYFTQSTVRYHTLIHKPTMHMFHIPQCTIQNRNVHISVLNDALWDME